MEKKEECDSFCTPSTVCPTPWSTVLLQSAGQAPLGCLRGEIVSPTYQISGCGLCPAFSLQSYLKYQLRTADPGKGKNPTGDQQGCPVTQEAFPSQEEN